MKFASGSAFLVAGLFISTQVFAFGGGSQGGDGSPNSPDFAKVKQQVSKAPWNVWKGLPKADEVDTWQRLGSHYALGFDQTGSPLGLFDLSYPSWNNLLDFGEVMIGSLGLGNLTLKQLIDLIKKEKKRNKGSSSLKSLDSDSLKKGNYHQLGARSSSFLPKGFWKKLPWKQEFSKREGASPSVIHFSHMDMSKLIPQSMRSRSRQPYFGAIHPLMEGLTFEKLVKSLLMKKNKKGQWDLYFDGSWMKAKQEVTAPVVIVDFQNPESSFTRGISLMLVEEGLGALIGAIPEPISNRILGYAVDRWLNLLEDQIEFHQALALYQVDTAELGDSNSPFSNLNPTQRDVVGTYLTNFITDPLDAIMVLIKNDFDTRWMKSLEDVSEDRDDVFQRLMDDGYEVNPLGNWHVSGKKGDTDKVYGGMCSYFLSKKPVEVYDLEDPKREIILRHLAEGVDLILSFVDIDIPFVKDVLEGIFSLAVSDPIGVRQDCEIGLIGELHRNQDLNLPSGSRNGWLKRLYELRLNPFELSVDEENQLINARRKAWGI